MKTETITNGVPSPVHWVEIPFGENYRSGLENQIKPWLTKMYGFHLIKVGNLSAEINTKSCTISHQVNISLEGKPIQVKADPLYLPFAEKSIDVCLLAQILPWCQDPHRLLREADRVLVDDGWLILSSFNPISLIGIGNLLPILRDRSPYNSRMFTLTRQIDWLFLLNFEVLHYNGFQVFPWSQHGEKLLATHFPALGCMQVIVARKRTIPLTLDPIKKNKKIHLRPAVGTGIMQK